MKATPLEMAKKDKITGIWSSNGFDSIWTASKKGMRFQGFWKYKNQLSPYNLPPNIPVAKGVLYLDFDENGQFDAKKDKRLGRFKADFTKKRIPNVAMGNLTMKPSKGKFEMLYNGESFATGTLRKEAEEWLAI